MVGGGDPGPLSKGLRQDLDLYVEMLRKWNAAINIISKVSLDDVWSRHIDDCLQIYDLAPANAQLWVDIGSGGGLPGAVAALAAKDRRAPTRFVLIESDQRKAAFLRNVSRETGAGFEVISRRIEDVSPLAANVLTARALASLDRLCEFAELHLAADGLAIFPKGETAHSEVAEARKNWEFDLTEAPSRTNPEAKILLIRSLRSARTRAR